MVQERRKASLDGVSEAPCYYPTAAEFEEPLVYIASIRQEAERYGICRICPPAGWKPPFAHKPDKLRFATKEQDLGKLAGTQRLRRKFTENLRKFLFLIGKPMESAFGGKIFVGDRGGGPVDMFRLFKDVQKMGGHEGVSEAKGWEDLAGRMGFPDMGQAMRDVYLRYLGDFQTAYSGERVEGAGAAYIPVVYREKASVEADIRVGMTLWHFLEEDHGAGRCYYGTVKAVRASNCIVEYDHAERLPEPHRRNASWDGKWACTVNSGADSNGTATISSGKNLRGSGNGVEDGVGEDGGGWSGTGRGGAGGSAGGAGWAGFRASMCEEVEAFRVTLPRSQLSTLVLNGKSPAAAKLAAHGVVCEVCSIAAASKAVLAVCASCDSAYHLKCVEPALPRVPFHDWFCGDCAKDGHTAQALARGPSGLFAILSASSSPSEHKPSTISKPADAVTPKGEHEQKKSAAAGGTENPRVTPAKRSHAGDAAVKSIAPGSSIPADDQSDKANSAKGAKENRKGFAASEAAAVRGDESQTLAASAGGITATSSVGSTGSNDGKGATEETRGVTAAGGAAEGGCHKGKDTETKAVRGGTRTTLTKAPGDASGGTEPTSTVAVVAVPVVPAGSAKPMQEESVASTASEAEEESVSESVSESDCSGMEARRSRGLARGKRRGRMRRNGGGGGSNAGASASGSASSRMRGGPSMKGRALKYGFGNGGVFTLKEYALMADGWRSSYLARRGLGDEATEEDMEAEFWKLVGPDPPEDDVKVLYGSDLDTGGVGSGFPWTTGASAALGKPAAGQGSAKRQKRNHERALGRGWVAVDDAPSYEGHSYEKDAWNLNCLPTSDGSLLQFLGTQIQGVMVPWLYVGMAFSAFCWHNEDHYLYSINYLHAGSPKRWYGVPGAMAGEFEAAVQVMFPELFEAHPDLLMQLVTMAHPSELAQRGVTVSSTTQKEGEFVLTFPQAYHAGFNLGTNCAEAVNFAPPDWLPWGNAAQERYRVHKRKPVFSHEGLVLSLVDLLSKQASNGVHASGELYRFLRDELEALAVAQELLQKDAERLGCTRFEPMDKLVERLRGWTRAPSLPTQDTSASTIISRRSSHDDHTSSSSSSSACSNATTMGESIVQGLESGSAVQGPRCAVCDQYCFLVAVMCDTCDGGGGGRAARASSGGSPGIGDGVGGGAAAAAASRRRHSRRRFACGRHLAELCSCPASQYAYYRRQDAAQLRAAAEGLTSVEEFLETWTAEARTALGAARGAGGGSASSFRSASSAKVNAAASAAIAEEVAGGSGDGIKVELPSSAGSTTILPPSASLSDGRADVIGAGVKVEDGKTDDDDDSDDDCPTDEAADASLSAPQLGIFLRDDESPLSLLPIGWQERPSLGYIGDMIRMGEELGAPERVLADLRQVVDACAGWVKTIEVILGPSESDSSAQAAATAIRFGTAKRAASLPSAAAGKNGAGGDAGSLPTARGRAPAGGRAAARGAGVKDSGPGLRNGARSESTPKRREQVPFNKTINLLSTEAKLPGRPAVTTDRLCVAMLAACRLRMQVRTLLGLGEDQHIIAARGMCLALQEAERVAAPLELASSVINSPSRCAGGGTAGATSADPDKPCGDGSGGDAGSSASSPFPGSRGSSPHRGSPGGFGVGGVSSFGSETFADVPGPINDINARPLGTARTRTRTNVSIPTGTLAAERGTWKMQPWRLWPVHQAAAASLVEPCLNSIVAVPEVALLRKALAALADRTDRAMVMVDSSTAVPDAVGGGGKRSRDRGDSAGGASGSGSASVNGNGGAVATGNGGGRTRRGAGGRGGGLIGISSGGGGNGNSSSGGGGSKAKLMYSPAVSGKGVSAGGGVLVGAAHKRRRQDAVVTVTSPVASSTLASSFSTPSQ